MTEKLVIRDFFEYFDNSCPYHNGSMVELQAAIEKADPSILTKDAQWFHTWSQSGKRRKERPQQEIWRHPWYVYEEKE